MPSTALSNAALVALHRDSRCRIGDQIKSPSNPPTQNGKYKTEMCRLWSEHKQCPYQLKCQFAHGPEELRPVIRHNLYKTEKCRKFHEEGVCSFGSRCVFIHKEAVALPNIASRVALPTVPPFPNTMSPQEFLETLKLGSIRLDTLLRPSVFTSDLYPQKH